MPRALLATHALAPIDPLGPDLSRDRLWWCARSPRRALPAPAPCRLRLQPNNYTALATAVATKGPIAVTVAAGGMGWQLYSRGIYSGGLLHHCGFTLDHGVQVVGYGSDGGKGYWWVRNSWGAM